MARHRFAVVTAAATWVLLFLGGLVTSTGSGLAVPDWPLSFGQVMPEMVGGVLFEHGHRMAASLVGFLTLILSIWTVVSETRPGVRALGVVMIVAVKAAQWDDVDSLTSFLGLEEIMYLALFLWLAIAGAGRVSLDHLLERRAA